MSKSVAAAGYIRPQMRTVRYVVAVLQQTHQMVANQRSTAMKSTRCNSGAAFKAQVALKACRGDKIPC